MDPPRGAKGSHWPRGPLRPTAVSKAAGGSLGLHYRDRRRLIAGIFFVIAAGIMAYSLSSAWWQVAVITSTAAPGSPPSQSQDIVLKFPVGGMLSCSSFGFSGPGPCANVSTTLGGVQEGLSQLLEVAIFGLVGAAVGAGSLAVAGMFGVVFGRFQLVLNLRIGLAITVVSLALALACVAVGPGSEIHGYCEQLSGQVTNCPSFWGGAAPGLIPGECSPCGYTMSWGAGLAWYELLMGGLVSLGGWYLLWVGRTGPYTRDEIAAWAGPQGPAPPETRPRTPPDADFARRRSPSLPPLPTTAGKSSYDLSGGRQEAWNCPSCGAANAPWSRKCGRCGTAAPRS